MIRIPAVATLLVVLAPSCAWSTVPDTATYDPVTGNYIFNFDCGDDGAGTTTIEPHNKVSPAIESKFTLTSGGFTYSYNISLGASSRQPLRMISLDPIQQVWNIVEPPSQAMLQGPTAEEIQKFQQAVVANAPSGWRVINFTNADGTARVGWSRIGAAPSTFAAGSKQSGFSFSSRHLPGVFAANFKGDGSPWETPCEIPATGPVADAWKSVLKNDSVPRLAAAPVIRVADPFDAISVLNALNNHVTQLEQWGLFDSAFAASLHGYLAEAISKLRGGDAAGAAIPLGKLRAYLRTKYPTLDVENALHDLPPSAIPQNPVDDIRKLVSDYDRVLAARVIDFDIAFVTDRLGPVAVPPPTSYDCNAPNSDTICAPVTDADGTFIVRWGAKSCPKQTPQDKSCTMETVKYRLETGGDPNFYGASQVYDGPALQFQVDSAAPGNHYFRVTADYRYCVEGLGLGYYSGYCDEDQMHWQTASDTYANGPNKTVVDTR